MWHLVANLCIKLNFFLLSIVSQDQWKKADCMIKNVLGDDGLFTVSPEVTGQVFSKRIKITPQFHIRRFEEQTTWERVPCWESFLTCECQKWLLARHPSSSCLFFKFSDVSLGSDFVPFFKKVTCMWYPDPKQWGSRVTRHQKNSEVVQKWCKIRDWRIVKIQTNVSVSKSFFYCWVF